MFECIRRSSKKMARKTTNLPYICVSVPFAQILKQGKKRNKKDKKTMIVAVRGKSALAKNDLGSCVFNYTECFIQCYWCVSCLQDDSEKGRSHVCCVFAIIA